RWRILRVDAIDSEFALRCERDRSADLYRDPASTGGGGAACPPVFRPGGGAGGFPWGAPALGCTGGAINFPKKEIYKLQLLIIFLLGISLVPAGAGASVADISGTWACSIEYGNGTRSNGTLVLKQEREKLTGVLSGQSGEYKISGTVKGDKVVFSFDITL